MSTLDDVSSNKQEPVETTALASADDDLIKSEEERGGCIREVQSTTDRFLANGDGMSGSNVHNANDPNSNEEADAIVSSEAGEEVLHPKAGLSPFSTSLIVVNYMSVSFLLLPGGFASGGTLLTSIILVCVSFQTYLTAKFVLETCARAESLTSALSQLDSSHRFGPPMAQSYVHQISHRKFELSALTQIFLGHRLSQFFTLTTCLDLYGITWTFCSVFASTLADTGPISGLSNEDSYYVYVAIFVVIAVPLANTSILDQLFVQLAFLSARLIMVFLMLTTLIVAFARPNMSFFGTQIGPKRDVPLADWTNLVQAVQTAIFATAFQFSVPAVAHVTSDKGILTRIFQTAVGFIFVTNIILALLASIYFGRGTNESSNLNWISYHGGTMDNETRSAWSALISYYIALFAAIDGIAIYPLIALSLGDIIMGAVYGEDVHEKEKNHRIRAVFRLLASIPQALGALVVRDLGQIAIFAGIFTILSYTVCPSLLCIKSKRRMKDANLPVKTFYSSTMILPSHWWACILLGLSFLAIVGVIVDSIFRFS